MTKILLVEDDSDMSKALTRALEKRGFEVTGLFPVTFDPRDKLRVVEFDCVMSRAPQDGTGAASAARATA